MLRALLRRRRIDAPRANNTPCWPPWPTISRAYRNARLGSTGGGAHEIMLSIICKHVGVLPGKRDKRSRAIAVKPEPPPRQGGLGWVTKAPGLTHPAVMKK